MHHPIATLTGEKRDAVYGFLVEHLGALGDVRIAIDRGEFDTARRLAREFAEDFRLLDDLGWAPDERSEVPLTIPSGELAAIFERLRADARGALTERADERESREDDEVSRRRYHLTLDTGTELLLELRTRRGSL
jgi:hypothetical protein